MSQHEDQIDVRVTGDEVEFDQEFMNLMWEPSRLTPYPVENTFTYDANGQRIGIVDLLCYLDQVNQELRDKGPEAIVEAVLELMTSVYIGNDEIVLVGKVVDLYAVELSGRAGIVFRAVIVDSNMEFEELQEIREIAKTLFPVPQPE